MQPCMRTKRYSNRSYVNAMCDQGLGLSPSPVAPQLSTYANIYKYIAIYITRTNQWRAGWRLFPSLSPCPEVAGSTPANNIILNQYTCDTWWPLIGPHVANPFAANKPCHMPTIQITACHMSYGLPRVVRPATSA
jgi:hypothetical protein